MKKQACLVGFLLLIGFTLNLYPPELSAAGNISSVARQSFEESGFGGEALDQESCRISSDPEQEQVFREFYATDNTHIEQDVADRAQGHWVMVDRDN